MLVLSRKVGERIQLGDNITVTLVKVSGNLVRLGIEAPANMPVVRQELLTRALQDKLPASKPAPAPASSPPPNSELSPA